MRMPREVERLVEEGRALSADDALVLERLLEHRPDDLATRARLLGHYSARQAKGFAERRAAPFTIAPSPERTARVRHAVWVAANAPRAPRAAHSLTKFPMRDSAYAELSQIWRRHAATEPFDPTLLAHAISFFWDENEPFAEELLTRAERVFPDDPRWLRFRQDRRASELCNEHRQQRVRVRRPNPDAPDDEAEVEMSDQSQRRLADIERLLREADPDFAWAPRLREIAANIALAFDRYDRARVHAEALLVSDVGVPELYWNDPAHHGHLLLGRIALRENDIARAKAHLVLAGEAGVTGLDRIFGPDMWLARELLVRGERDVVIRYLTACRALWERAPTDEWIAEIRAGGIPDFRANLRR